MELTVFRQAQKIRPDGTIVYKGEDARPYVGDQLFMVLDGLGGSASSRHTEFDSRMFDEKKLADVLFRGVFEEGCDDPRFLQYVRDSFFELFAVRDCYEDNLNNVKKSGYFASRIVACIMLHWALYNPGQIRGIFSELRESAAAAEEGAEEAKRTYAAQLEKIGEYFAGMIRTKLAAAAGNVHLVNESSFSNMILLGTTLCAAFFREDETGVDCLYLTAGDSRPYLWTEAEGLQQLLPDEERDDGVMTNCINAGGGKPFHVRCDHFRFEKPCVLFNATDGCFDSGSFYSPMALEDLLLRTFRDSADEEAAAQTLTDFFVSAGRHDDSSTIALKAFGYEYWQDLAAAAGRRLETMERAYLARVPALLDTNYAKQLRKTEENRGQALTDLWARLYESEAVREYCRADVRAGAWAPYTEGMKALEAQRSELGADRDDAVRKAEAVIRRHFSLFLKAMDRSLLPGRVMPNLRDAERAFSDLMNCERSYMESLRLSRTNFEQAVASLREILEKAEDRGTALLAEGPTATDFEGLNVSRSCLFSAADFLTRLRARELEAQRRYAGLRRKYEESEDRLAAWHPEALAACRDAVLSGALDTEALPLSEEDRSALAAVGETGAAAEEKAAELDGAAEGLLEDSARDYWAAEHEEILKSVLNDPGTQLPEELRAEAEGLLEPRETDGDDLSRLAGEQKAVFDEYARGYLRFIGGEE